MPTTKSVLLTLRAARPRQRLLLASLALISAFALAACSGGGGGDAETPFVVLAEQLSVASSAIELPPVEGASDATPDAGVPTTGEARVGNTGGDGVSLRDACADGARVGGAWAEGTTVEVVEGGTGECEGWSNARAAGVSSWVRNDYLVGLTPGEGSPVLLPGGPEITLHGWFAELLDGSGRVSLLARRPLGQPTPELTMTSLRYVMEDMQSLATLASAAGPFVGPCEQARAELTEAASTLAGLAGGIATAIETSGPREALSGTTTRYVGQQESAADAFSSCAGA